jgi:cytochrome d ubiquinol oxidase subunit II
MILYWTFVLAVGLALYVLLDGFDLGVGILFAGTRSETVRQQMLGAISPVWDGNETWLVLAGTVLWATFPLVYSILLSAFYIPLMMMLGALILRGVAFEFRYKTKRARWVWDAGFILGSVLATFMQGATVGTLVQGLPVIHDEFAGKSSDWLTPFSALCGLGLCMGYALLGAAWLVLKTEGGIRDFGYRAVPWLLAGVLTFLVVVFFSALIDQLHVLHRWIERPWLVVFPVAGLVGCLGIMLGLQKRWDSWPFLGVVLIFLAAFGTLAGSFWPYMIPDAVTIAEAAAPKSSLDFMFWGIGAFIFPLVLIYNVVIYVVFRGKVSADQTYH